MPASHTRPTRRSLLLLSGFASAAAALAFPELMAASAATAAPADETDERDAVRLRRLADVEVETYPWGSIRWLVNGKIDPRAEMTMGLVEFKPRQINVRHVHPNSAEFLHALSGVSEHLMGDDWVTLRPGDTLRIPRNVPHQARTLDEPFRALIVYDTPTRVMVPVTGKKGD